MKSVVMAVVVVLMAFETTAKSAKPVRCRQYKCGSDCYPGKRPDGCPTCDCPPTCEGFNCENGQVCKLQQVKCFTTPCFDQPTCVDVPKTSCPMVKCGGNCYSRPGEDGCPQCYCPCSTIKCSVGHECQLVDVQCFAAPCYPQGQCVETTKTSCPMVKCGGNCYSKPGEDGCPQCYCPCSTMKCSAGYECQLKDVQCYAAPCYPAGQCVKAPVECGPVCDIACENGHQRDENGCEVCACNPPSSAAE